MNVLSWIGNDTKGLRRDLVAASKNPQQGTTASVVECAIRFFVYLKELQDQGSSGKFHDLFQMTPSPPNFELLAIKPAMNTTSWFSTTLKFFFVETRLRNPAIPDAGPNPTGTHATGKYTIINSMWDSLAAKPNGALAAHLDLVGQLIVDMAIQGFIMPAKVTKLPSSKAQSSSTPNSSSQVAHAGFESAMLDLTIIWHLLCSLVDRCLC